LYARRLCAALDPAPSWLQNVNIYGLSLAETYQQLCFFLVSPGAFVRRLIPRLIETALLPLDGIYPAQMHTTTLAQVLISSGTKPKTSADEQ
jgi:hypothetical protein